jgi:DNA-binding NarL/FixJ family response regulator
MNREQVSREEPAEASPKRIMMILIVDDHKIIRDGLRAILEKHQEMVVVGEAANGHEALALLPKINPNIAIVDVTMPGLNGIEATRRITSEAPAVKVLALSMNADRRYVVAMLAAGAAGYLLKNAAADELIRALHAIGAGQTYLCPGIAGVVVNTMIHQTATVEAPRVLSSRELQVLQLLAEGQTSKEIAARLEVAVTTIETHRRQIMDKLNLRSIAELTKYAVREGLTSLDP